MARLIKSSSKKTLKEADIPVYSDDIIEDTEADINTSNNIDSDDEAPEAVSMSTSKAEIISQIKSEREARRLEREAKRQKTANLQLQNQKARLRKSKELEAIEDEISASDTEEAGEKKEQELCPLPENILESAIENNQNQKKIRFDLDSESEESANIIDPADIAETVRSARAKATKRRLIQNLPYAVVEVGINGVARISKAEIKARRAISKQKMEKAGLQVRRIDSVIDRARKNRSAASVFYRQNSFY
jgi:hypothetical protein